MNHDIVSINDGAIAALGRNWAMSDKGIIVGEYHAIFRDPDGNVFREETFPNLVTDVGAIALLTQYLKGSAWTAGTSYLGLIGTSTAPAVTQTMASTGWTECGTTQAPTYGAVRGTVTWGTASGSGAGSRQIAATIPAFTFTATPGTVYGAFIVLGGTSAVLNTTGTLFSCGTFSGGSQAVTNGATLTVSYTLNI